MKYHLRRNGAYIRMAMTEMSDEEIYLTLLKKAYISSHRRTPMAGIGIVDISELTLHCIHSHGHDLYCQCCTWVCRCTFILPTLLEEKCSFCHYYYVFLQISLLPIRFCVSRRNTWNFIVVRLSISPCKIHKMNFLFDMYEVNVRVWITKF